MFGHLAGLGDDNEVHESLQHMTKGEHQVDETCDPENENTSSKLQGNEENEGHEGHEGNEGNNSHVNI